MARELRNVGASVRARILERARAGQGDFQILLMRYALERFLYRLSVSEHRDRFVLKGAMLFVAWVADPFRPTRDLDLLGLGSQRASESERDGRDSSSCVTLSCTLAACGRSCPKGRLLIERLARIARLQERSACGRATHTDKTSARDPRHRDSGPCRRRRLRCSPRRRTRKRQPGSRDRWGHRP